MENDYAEETQFLSDKAAEKSRFRQDPPRVFDMLQYFETILPSVESLNDLLNKMRYILWVVARLEACDITNNNDRHLGFYQELEIRLK